MCSSLTLDKNNNRVCVITCHGLLESQIYLDSPSNIRMSANPRPRHLTPQLLRYCYMTVLRYFNQFHCLLNELSVPYLQILPAKGIRPVGPALVIHRGSLSGKRKPCSYTTSAWLRRLLILKLLLTVTTLRTLLAVSLMQLYSSDI